MVHAVQHISIHHVGKTESAQRDIHGNSAMKQLQMKMTIRSIDDGKSLERNNEESGSKANGLIIDQWFHTVHFFPNATRLISTSKSVQASAPSNISSNMFSRAAIAQLQY